MERQNISCLDRGAVSFLNNLNPGNNFLIFISIEMDNYPSLFIKAGLIYALLGAAGLRE